MAKKCPICKYPEMNSNTNTYYGVKNVIYIDTSKTTKIIEYDCPRCGYFDRDVSTT